MTSNETEPSAWQLLARITDLVTAYPQAFDDGGPTAECLYRRGLPLMLRTPFRSTEHTS